MYACMYVWYGMYGMYGITALKGNFDESGPEDWVKCLARGYNHLILYHDPPRTGRRESMVVCEYWEDLVELVVAEYL